MTDHLKQSVSLAHSLRWNKAHVCSEERNRLNRNIQLSGVQLGSDVCAGVELLVDADVQLLSGRRYGLIGRNGVGKTTFLKAVAQHRIMGVFDHLRIAYVDDGGDCDAEMVEGAIKDATHARPSLEGPSVLAYLIGLHEERVRWFQEVQSTIEKQEYSLDEENPSMKLCTMDCNGSALSRLHVILSGLGISGEESIASLSGGCRHRVVLAASLFLQPDVLLLDEPTNHLDTDGILWLQQYLNRADLRRTTVCVVSHDTDFLDSFVSEMIVMEDKKLKQYVGTYSDFVATRQAEVQKHTRMYKAQEKLRRRLEDTIARLQARAATSPTGKYSGSIRSRQRQLENRLGASLDGHYWKYGTMGPRPEILAPLESEPFCFDFLTDVSDVPIGHTEFETTLMEVSDVGFHFDSGKTTAEGSPTWIFRRVTLKNPITLSTRLGLVGRNGSGKSTLLKLMSDYLPPKEGDVIRWCGLRIGRLEQHAVKALAHSSGGCTALRWLSERYGVAPFSERQQELRNALGRMGLHGIYVEEVHLSQLSDGQRARVLFADILIQEPHILLLDEPTSHLDMETTSALASALVDFEGAVVVASHHKAFLSEVCNEFFSLDQEMFGPVSSLEQVWDAKQRRQCIPLSSVPLEPKRLAARNAEEEAELIRSEQRALTASEVRCRHCQGSHFSHACPQRVPSSKTRSFEVEEEERRRQWSEGQQVILEAQTAKKSKLRLPSTKERASDGNGDWNVAVSKSVKRRLERGK